MSGRSGELKKERLFKAMKSYWEERDLMSLHESTSVHLRIPRDLLGPRAPYLNSILPWSHACALVQTRLANHRFQCLALGGTFTRFQVEDRCRACNAMRDSLQ